MTDECITIHLLKGVLDYNLLIQHRAHWERIPNASSPDPSGITGYLTWKCLEASWSLSPVQSNGVSTLRKRPFVHQVQDSSECPLFGWKEIPDVPTEHTQIQSCSFRVSSSDRRWSWPIHLPKFLSGVNMRPQLGIGVLRWSQVVS